MHTYTTSIRIAAAAERVFAFHTEPANLLRITPDKITVEILRFDPAGEGAMVELRVRPLPLIAARWLMRFDVFEPPAGDRHGRLQDTQQRGPFRSWRQLREFIPDGPEASVLRDTVEYALPLGALGRLLDRLIVRREVRKMFHHRQAAIKRLLEATY